MTVGLIGTHKISFFVKMNVFILVSSIDEFHSLKMYFTIFTAVHRIRKISAPQSLIPTDKIFNIVIIEAQ